VVGACLRNAEAEIVELGDELSSAVEGHQPPASLGPLFINRVEVVGADDVRGCRDADFIIVQQNVRIDSTFRVVGEGRRRKLMPAPHELVRSRVQKIGRGVAVDEGLEVASENIHDVERFGASGVMGVGATDGQGHGAASLGFVEARQCLHGERVGVVEDGLACSIKAEDPALAVSVVTPVKWEEINPTGLTEGDSRLRQKETVSSS
jgi:hypothetical protein